MKKIVIFGEALTYPPKEGITAHVFSTLEELSKISDIEPILVMADRGFFDRDILDSRPWLTILVPPDIFYDFEKIREVVADLSPDILQSYNVYQARLIGMPLATQLKIPFVFEHHDLELDLSDFLGLPKTLSEDNQRYQKDILHYASINRVTSHYDYKILTDAYKSESSVLKTLAWLPVSQTDVFGANPTKVAPNNGVLFVGNGGYPPNTQAVLFILDVLAPANPHLHFHIIGRITDTLCEQYGYPNVTGYGQVDDLRAVVSQCFVGIIPIAAGSGMKVKVLTYLSAGLPVIGTPIAFHGYDRNKALLRADTADKYSECFITLLKNNAWHAYGVKARQVFEKSFNATTIASKLAQHYRHLPDHLSDQARCDLTPIERNDNRLSWIHEIRDAPFKPTDLVIYKGKRS